jgi:endonuclease I
VRLHASKKYEAWQVLEWEHVVSAYYLGRTRVCWTKGDKQCVNSKGKPFKGRECCARVDNTFKRMEADLHNLAPAMGELNGDRSNQPFCLVKGEPRQYGACDFEIGGKPRVTEPREDVRGDADRIWLYMAGDIRTETYASAAENVQRLGQWLIRLTHGSFSGTSAAVCVKRSLHAVQLPRYCSIKNLT